MRGIDVATLIVFGWGDLDAVLLIGHHVLVAVAWGVVLSGGSGVVDVGSGAGDGLKLLHNVPLH